MKRPLEILKAFKKGSSENDYLLVVGNRDDISTEEVCSLGGDLGLRNLRVTGGLYGVERDDAYLASDVFVSFSYRENFGHTAAEAMSFSLPCILSTGNDIIGELEGVNWGWSVCSFQELVHAFQTVSSLSNSERFKIGELNREFVGKNFGFDKFKRKLVNLRNLTIG
jgi:glycosyltransferase involved in cell wall biosynthesis